MLNGSSPTSPKERLKWQLRRRDIHSRRVTTGLDSHPPRQELNYHSLARPATHGYDPPADYQHL